MKFVLPKTVLVHGKIYRVRRVPRSRLVVDGCPKEGVINFETAEILLDRNLRGEALRAAYEHEVFHAICFETGITHILYELVGQKIADYLEEAFNLHAAPAWLSSLRRP